ncbi:MAG: hypothetical protein E7579_08975 [Ruminococcaceae bacterium]|nr:hypothetical protein [Oscillospiraceae bacterium]
MLMNLNSHHYFSKIAAAGLCLSMLSMTSCGLIEMRDSYEETTKEEVNTAMMLAPAERVNEVEVRTEILPETVVEEEVPKTVLTFTAAGDIRIDDAIIADAANRAAEGSTYSFLRMYSGVYRAVHDSDVAVGRYSTASSPYSADNTASEDKSTPIESLAALAEMGFEVLDTTGSDTADDYSDDMTEYGIGNLHASLTGEQGVYTVEQDGITLAFLATDGTSKNVLLKSMDYAKSVSDVIVVSVDWKDGTTEKQKKNFAGILAGAGADIILGSDDVLGSAEWVDTGDGSPALVVYSLGNFAATADTAEALCGGILSLDITFCEGEISLENVCVEPTIVHYGADSRNYQIFRLSSYTSDISASHAVEGLDIDVLADRVGEILDDEFLPSDFQD